jgi:tetratricopeptide (TPR) repeat protein
MRRLLKSFLLFFWCTGLCFSQARKLDSLKNILKTVKSDSLHFKTLMHVGDYFQRQKPDSSIKYHSLAKELSLKLDPFYRAEAIRAIGADHFLMNDYPTALTYFDEALKIADQLEASNIKGAAEHAVHIRSNVFDNIGSVHYSRGEYETALDYYFKALKMDEKRGSLDGQASLLSNIGIVYWIKGEMPAALKCTFKALKIHQTLKNKIGEVTNLGNIGNIYIHKGEYEKALSYYSRALSINEVLENKHGVSSNLANMATTYFSQGHHAKALEYFFKALKACEEIDDKQGQATNLGNIGIVYKTERDWDKALEYYMKSLRINETIGSKHGRMINISSIGVAYNETGQKTKAMEYYLQAIELSQEIGSNRNTAINLANLGVLYKEKGDSVLDAHSAADQSAAQVLAAPFYQKTLDYCLAAMRLGDQPQKCVDYATIGSVYIKQKKLEQAEKYTKLFYELANEIGSLDHIKQAHFNLSKVYELKGTSDLALFHYKEAIRYRDSVFNNETTKKTIRQELKFNYDKKAAADSVKVAQEKKLSGAKLKQEKTQRFALYGGLGLMAVLAGFIVKRFRVTQKQKRIIELKEEETHKRNEIISHQKELVEEKQQEILDSILYAQRIQKALITNERYIQRSINRLKKV